MYIGGVIPKISILIPVYNVEKYLRECLESAINQTEKDIEIICVDDASEDGSLKILQEYINRDARIKLIKHAENMGLCKTRKDAVEIANGKYILFLDSDDYISLNTCEKLYAEMLLKDVDFLQFGTNLLQNENVSEEMYSWVENFLRPSIEDIDSDNLARECFVNHKFNCNLWNKIYKREICQLAYKQIKEGNYTSAEDRYAMFFICHYARKYRGIEEKYYYYRVGVGVTGGNVLDLKRFESRCKASAIVKNVEQFIESQEEQNKYKDVLQEYKRDILLDCIDCWMNKLSENNRGYGWENLLRYWDIKEVISTIAGRYFEEQEKVLRCSELDKNRCVALYYRTMGDKYSEKILRYVEYLKSIDCRVVLITDKDALITNKMYLNCQLKSIFSATEANWSMYEKRCVDWIELIKRENIEVVYYLSPTSHVVKLDELIIRTLNSQFVICMDEYEWKEKSNYFVKIKNKLRRIKRDV